MPCRTDYISQVEVERGGTRGLVFVLGAVRFLMTFLGSLRVLPLDLLIVANLCFTVLQQVVLFCCCDFILACPLSIELWSASINIMHKLSLVACPCWRSEVPVLKPALTRVTSVASHIP